MFANLARGAIHLVWPETIDSVSRFRTLVPYLIGHFPDLVALKRNVSNATLLGRRWMYYSAQTVRPNATPGYERYALSAWKFNVEIVKTLSTAVVRTIVILL